MRFPAEGQARLSGLNLVTWHWRDIRNLGHGRLELLAAATLGTPLKFAEILESAGKFFQFPQRKDIDRLMVV